MEPKGPKRARNPLKNREGKRHQKGTENKPVLAWEREARLKGELCTDMVPDVLQPRAPRVITETLQSHTEPPRATQSHPEPPRATRSHPEAPGGTERHPEALKATQRNPEPNTKGMPKEYLRNI